MTPKAIEQASPDVRMLRFLLGRALIHLGLRVLPSGRVKSELYQLIDEWATTVAAVSLRAKGPGHEQ